MNFLRVVFMFVSCLYTISGPFSFGLRSPKYRALHERMNHALHTAAFGFGFFHDVVDVFAVGETHGSAQGEGGELSSDVLEDEVLVLYQQISEFLKSLESECRATSL